MIEEQDKLTQKLQEQLWESNRVQFTQAGGRVQQGKNAMCKMKKMYTQDECNYNRISHIIHHTIWRGNKMLTKKSGQHFEIIHKEYDR